MVPKELSTLPVTGKFYKWCPHCKTNYYSDARGQKYCCPEHAKLAAAKKKEQGIRYAEIAPVERLRVRAHSLAVETYRVLVELGLRPNHCENPECCSVERNEIHHKDLNWLNGTPLNITNLCHKCHTKEHSRMAKEANAAGIVLDELYADDFLPFARIINKDKL